MTFATLLLSFNFLAGAGSSPCPDFSPVAANGAILSASCARPSIAVASLLWSTQSPEPAGFSSCVQKAVCSIFYPESTCGPMGRISLITREVLISFSFSLFLRLTHCSMYHNSIPFYGWILSHCIDILPVAYPFICWGTFGLNPQFWLDPELSNPPLCELAHQPFLLPGLNCLPGRPVQF